jgi:two-component system, OmpR family, response regulator
MIESLHILLVEDDLSFGNMLRDYLSIHEYAVDLCLNGEEGLEKFRASDYDLIITDVMMPLKDGFSFVNDLRKINRIIPVIYLTARNQKEDIIKGYQSGADDYLTKPFDSEVLLHKINAVVQRSAKQRNTIPADFHLGRFVFIPTERKLIANGIEDRLSPREGELLLLLLQRKGELVQRTIILNTIWGDDSYFNNRSLDVYITKLRKRFSSDSSILIESLYGSGVRLLY